MDAIVCDDLTRAFGAVRAVDGISFSVPAGCVFTLLGSNGAGKTTTIHLLLETLLASRLSSESLLAGKIAFNVLYAWGASLLLVVVCVVSANVPALGRTVTLPTIGVTLTILLLLPLMLVFLAAAGALVSLRSPTVRQAQTMLVASMMGLWFLLAVPFLALRSGIPDVAARMTQVAEKADDRRSLSLPGRRSHRRLAAARVPGGP